MKKQIKLLLSFGLLIAGFSLIAMEAPEATAESSIAEKKFKYLLFLPSEVRFQIYDQMVADAPENEKFTVLNNVALINKQIAAEVRDYMKTAAFRSQIGINLADLVYTYIKNPLDAQLKKIEKLIDLGINLNSKDTQEGQTALILAVMKNNKEIAEKLINAGADLNAQDARFGTTALMGAHAEIVDKLLATGADPNAQDNNGTTALMRASRDGYAEIVDKLLAAGADPNAQDNNGTTALIWASMMNHAEIVDKLLAAGADPNMKAHNGTTALMLSLVMNHAEIVDKLLAAGADQNAQDNNGATALMGAARYGLIDMVDKLLAAGADPMIQDSNGKTAHDYATVPKIRNMLLEVEKRWLERMTEEGTSSE